MENDHEYVKFDPYAICTTLQGEHGCLITDSDWPALAVKLPESNNMAPEEGKDEKLIQCYCCKQRGHKANDLACPLFNKKMPNNQSQDQVPNKRFKPKDPWKYIEPKDLTKLVIVDDKKYFFCTKCRCHATGNVGYYQLSHTDATHNPDWKPEGNVSPIDDPDPTPHHPL